MKLNVLVTLMFAVTAFSGCLGYEEEENETVNEQNEALLDEECMEFEGLERCWDVYIPQGINPNNCLNVSCPIVIDIHGFGGTPEMQKAVSGFDDLADEYGFLVVYPRGYENSWNSGWCCGEARDEGLNDVGFLIKMTLEVEQRWNTDPERRYVTGLSNGCSMSQRLANEASHIFTAVGCMAHYLLEQAYPGYSPIPIMEVHGTLDPIVPYGISYTSSAIFANNLKGEEGAVKNLEVWADMNVCSGSSPDIEIVEYDFSIIGYSQCQNNTEVRLLTLNFGGHNPYVKDYPIDDPILGPILTGNPTGLDVSRLTWEFVSKYSKG